MKALDWLYGLQGIGVKLGLENMRRLIGELPTPAQRPLTFHVAGTNGKGSVCACLDAITRAHGLKTGLFTSPHLIHYRERMRVDGQCISDADLSRLLDHWRERLVDWDPHPSFFEVTLAVALQHFYEQEVECLVLETGLGGRLDASNALDPKDICIITPIHYDHTRILGDRLDQIAREKAGIFRAGVPIVSAAQPPEAELALREEAARHRAPIDFVTESYQGSLGLVGAHQRENAALAIAAAQASGLTVSEENIAKGLAGAHWPGRFHAVGERHTVDGAHNLSSIEALVQAWRERHGEARATVIYGCARDKEPKALLDLLGSLARRFLLIPIPSPRSEDPQIIASLIEETDARCEVIFADNIADADRRAREFDEPILFTGSLFLAGAALAHLEGNAAPTPSLQ